MTKYRKKPIVIDALKYDNTKAGVDAMDEFLGGTSQIRNSFLMIETLEGTMYANVGDWIIKGVNGEFYPCKPDIFEKSYEKVYGLGD